VAAPCTAALRDVDAARALGLDGVHHRTHDDPVPLPAPLAGQDSQAR
jgi:hypothetical protein